jgi:hypothetical protein
MYISSLSIVSPTKAGCAVNAARRGKREPLFSETLRKMISPLPLQGLLKSAIIFSFSHCLSISYFNKTSQTNYEKEREGEREREREREIESERER